MDAAYTHVGTAQEEGPRFNAPEQTGMYRTAVFAADPSHERDPVAEAATESDSEGPVLAPQDSSDRGVNIVIYGRDTCPNTTALRRALDNEGIPYTMRNVDNTSVNRDMWETLRSADEVIGTTQRLPVVKANGVVFGGIRSADRVKQALRGEL